MIKQEFFLIMNLDGAHISQERYDYVSEAQREAKRMCRVTQDTYFVLKVVSVGTVQYLQAPIHWEPH
jgi:hypothetical protein